MCTANAATSTTTRKLMKSQLCFKAPNYRRGCSLAKAFGVFNPSQRQSRELETGLVDRDWRSRFDSFGQANHVPVRQPDAAMAQGMSYGIGSSCAMDAD